MGGIFWLIERFEEFADNTAIIYRDRSFDYNWLVARIEYWKRQLIKKNVMPGEIVALSGDYSPDSCSLLIALISHNNIIVPLPEILKEEQLRFAKIAQADKIFILKEGQKFFFRGLKAHKKKHSLIEGLRNGRRGGIILFSSGSTGESKAILHDSVKLLSRYLQKRKRLITVPFLFLDHIGGLNTLFYTLASGGTLVIAKERSPKEICAAIEKHRVELLPVSPTFLNLLLISGAYKGRDLASLKIISYGTEVMPVHTLKRLNRIFPGARLVQTYGLSELGILFSKSKGSSSLWMKLGGDGYKIKIIDNQLWIKSDFSMLGYLNAPNPFRHSGWFKTGDLIEKDKKGYIKIIGRHSDIINVGGQKVNPNEVENVIMKMDGVKDATVFAEKNAILGNIVCARIKLKDGRRENQEHFKHRMRIFCNKELPLYKIPARVIFSDDIYCSRRFKKIRR